MRSEPNLTPNSQTLSEQELGPQSEGRRARRSLGAHDSLEGWIGAVAADFFIVGDVRDLVIEGGELALDGESDEVILALSGIGLATATPGDELGHEHHEGREARAHSPNASAARSSRSCG